MHLQLWPNRLVFLPKTIRRIAAELAHNAFKDEVVLDVAMDRLGRPQA